MAMTYDNMRHRYADAQGTASAGPVVHIHYPSNDTCDAAELEQSSPCENLEERVNALEEAVAVLISDEPDNEPVPDESDERRPTTLPREQWSDSQDLPDDDAGSGGAKNRGIPSGPSSPKIDVPASRLPDIAEINRRNTAFWSGALTNQYSPGQGNSINEAARLSDTPRQLDRGKVFGVTSDALRQGNMYRAQREATNKKLASISEANARFYGKQGGRQ
jgi:hypothetical protein